MAVRVNTLLIEFTVSFLHEVAAQLSLVVDTEVFDVLEHLFARSKIHELLLPVLLVWQTKTLLHLQLLQHFPRIARVLIGDFVELGGEIALLGPVDRGVRPRLRAYQHATIEWFPFFHAHLRRAGGSVAIGKVLLLLA